jgi:hypothetical protein
MRAQVVATRTLVSELFYYGGNMAKHKQSVSGDNALREFYEFCGLSQNTIEGAIKARYEEPTRMVNWQKAMAHVKATRGRWSGGLN